MLLRFLLKNLPQHLISVSFSAQTDCGNMAADLMLQLIQSFQLPDLLLSGKLVSGVSTMNGKLVSHHRKKNLFFVISKTEIPGLDVVHALSSNTATCAIAALSVPMPSGVFALMLT